jgi:hypothetical protein
VGVGGMGVWNSYNLSPALYSPQKMPSMPPSFQSSEKKPIPIRRTAGEKGGAGGTRKKYLLDVSIKKDVTKELKRSDVNQIDRVRVLLKLE